MSYSTQSDLEKRIGVKTLAEFSNDNSNLYIFTVSGITITPTAGSIYTNNGQTFTIVSTSINVGAGTITCTYSGIPTTSGSLTKSSGTGDSAITFSAGTASDASIVTSLIARADAFIDNTLNSVYNVPFIPTPVLIGQFSADLACYYAMQRRMTSFVIPDNWNDIYDNIIKGLERLATKEDALNDKEPDFNESQMNNTTSTPVLDFYSRDNEMSIF